MVDVYCPKCGAVLPFSVFARQVAKRKHDRKLILKIIQSKREITTGELAKEYQILSGSVVSLRHIGNILREFKQQGKIETKRLKLGRYGQTTLIQAINNTDLTDITRPHIHHV